MDNNARNLLVPFRRDRKSDFASGSGADLLRSKVIQAVMTRGTTPRSSGELPWRTAFGTGLDLLRHQRNDHVLAELARIYIRDTLDKWVPEVKLIGVRPVRSDATIKLQIKFEPSRGNHGTEPMTVNFEL